MGLLFPDAEAQAPLQSLHSLEAPELALLEPLPAHRPTFSFHLVATPVACQSFHCFLCP